MDEIGYVAIEIGVVNNQRSVIKVSKIVKDRVAVDEKADCQYPQIRPPTCQEQSLIKSVAIRRLASLNDFGLSVVLTCLND